MVQGALWQMLCVWGPRTAAMPEKPFGNSLMLPLATCWKKLRLEGEEVGGIRMCTKGQQ